MRATQPFEGPVPAVFALVEQGLAVRDPADIAGLRRAQREGVAALVRFVPLDRLERVPEIAHRCGEPGSRRSVQRLEQILHARLRTGIEAFECRASLRIQREQHMPSVVRARAAGEQAARPQPRHDAAQVRLVDADAPHDLGRGLLGAGQLEQHARLGQGEGAAREPLVEQPHGAGIEAVEAAQLGHRVHRDPLLSPTT